MFLCYSQPVLSGLSFETAKRSSQPFSGIRKEKVQIIVVDFPFRQDKLVISLVMRWPPPAANSHTQGLLRTALAWLGKTWFPELSRQFVLSATHFLPLYTPCFGQA